MATVTARLAEHYPELPDVAGFPERYQLDFQLDVLDRDPNDPLAQDAVTVSLQAQGIWEAHETLAAVDILAHHPGAVLDFGAHVGWYSLLGHLFGGHPVVAWENELATAGALCHNLSRHGVRDVTLHGQLDAGGPPVEVDGPVSLVKVDLEGADCWAVDACADLFEAGRVAGALVEVSPIFEEDGRGVCAYVDLVARLASWGYRAHQVPPKGWDRLGQYRDDPLGTLRACRALGADWADVVAGCRQDNFVFLPE